MKLIEEEKADKAAKESNHKHSSRTLLIYGEENGFKHSGRLT